MDDVELLLEKCSELWNDVKDCQNERVNETRQAKIKCFEELLVHLQRSYSQLSDHHPSEQSTLKITKAKDNVKLRLLATFTALNSLKKCSDSISLFTDRENTYFHGLKKCNNFRRWLHHVRKKLDNIRNEVSSYKTNYWSNSIDLKQLHQTQMELHSQLASNGLWFCNKIDHDDDEDREPTFANPAEVASCSTEFRSRTVERRYFYDIWLASLENLELIKRLETEANELGCESNFGKVIYSDEPPNKRRKMNSSFFSESESEESFDPLDDTKRNSAIDENKQSSDNVLLAKNHRPHSSLSHTDSEELPMDFNGRRKVRRLRQKPERKSDYGYSSGNSPKNVEISNNRRASTDRIWKSSKWQRSFQSYYKTVPLDEWGMTDIDIDIDDDQESFDDKTFLSYDYISNNECENAKCENQLSDSMICEVGECSELWWIEESPMELILNERKSTPTITTQIASVDGDLSLQTSDDTDTIELAVECEQLLSDTSQEKRGSTKFYKKDRFWYVVAFSLIAIFVAIFINPLKNSDATCLWRISFPFGELRYIDGPPPH